MINGAHVIIYSRDAEADRAFLKDVLGFRNVDVGHGWLIFALPDAEAAVHPAETSGATYVAMRNSKQLEPVLTFTMAEWDAFVLGAKDGEFDEPW